jgi:membrane protease subunit HflC
MNQLSKPLAKSLNILLIMAGVFIVMLTQSLFIVKEQQQAIILQFGAPSQVISKAGLHVKAPFIQDVRFFDRRILSVDPEPERVILISDRNSPLRDILESGEKNPQSKDEVIDASSSGEPIVVDTFARYRITDPLKFMQRLVDEDRAARRIENVMNDATRDVLGKTTLRRLLSPQRSAIMEMIRDRANDEMKDRGIEIVDIRIVRADLTDRLRESTVKRMITERQERAAETRAKGQAAAREIRALADKERDIIIAKAQSQAQIDRGQGDEIAIKTYAAAFNQDPQFYEFTRSLEAYKTGLGKDTKTRFVLGSDSPFLKYLKQKPAANIP